jgi:hypothetical protein
VIRPALAIVNRDHPLFAINAQHTQNVPGRKSDVPESPGLLKLHAFGRLNNSFSPAMRSGWRAAYGDTGAIWWPRRAGDATHAEVWTEMNVQLSKVWSDLPGVSGGNIIPAIWDRERDPWTLAAWVEPGVQAPPEEIIPPPLVRHLSLRIDRPVCGARLLRSDKTRGKA